MIQRENWDTRDFEDVKAIIKDYKGEVVYKPMKIHEISQFFLRLPVLEKVYAE